MGILDATYRYNSIVRGMEDSTGTQDYCTVPVPGTQNLYTYKGSFIDDKSGIKPSLDGVG
jgi:hypothetical protein